MHAVMLLHGRRFDQRLRTYVLKPRKKVTPSGGA